VTIPAPPPPKRKLQEDSKLYEVENIIDEKGFSKGKMFLIKWKGIEEAEWVQSKTLVDCDYLKKEFKKRKTKQTQ
jgi:hypothetical protein